MGEWLDIGGPVAEVIARGSAVFATRPDSGDIWEYTGELDNWRRIGGPGSMFTVSFSFSQGGFTSVLFGLSLDKSAVYQHKYSGTPM
jgi:hypothetical protein